MLTEQKMANVEKNHDCRFVESNIAGVNFMVSDQGWAILTESGKRGITGDWNSLGMLAEELIGLKEVYGKKKG